VVSDSISKLRRKRKSYPYKDSNSESYAVHPVASRYTDCAIPAQTSAWYLGYECMELYVHFPIRLHGVELKTETVLLHLIFTPSVYVILKKTTVLCSECLRSTCKQNFGNRWKQVRFSSVYMSGEIFFARYTRYVSS
jgi:hypothetical protein